MTVISGHERQQSPASANPATDTARLLERCAGDRETLMMLIEVFGEEYGAWAENLQRAASSRDAAAIRFVAHTIKGAVAVFSDHLSARAGELEARAKQGQVDDAAERASTIARDLAALAAALRRVALEIAA